MSLDLSPAEGREQKHAEHQHTHNKGGTPGARASWLGKPPASSFVQLVQRCHFFVRGRYIFGGIIFFFETTAPKDLTLSFKYKILWAVQNAPSKNTRHTLSNLTPAKP
jgi:hypothetical protein